ncbi:hypothetical protein SARC_14607, partial [Sphaeroforma arctica JP610]
GLSHPTSKICYLQYEKFFAEEKKRLDAAGQQLPKDYWFTKQTIGNACGTIGLLHALGNSRKSISIDGELGKFFDSTESMTPADKAEFLTKAEGISAAHHESANEGQTAVCI